MSRDAGCGPGAHARAGAVGRGNRARPDGVEGARAQGRDRRHQHGAALTAIKALGTANGFTRRRGRRRRRTSTRPSSSGYQALVFLNVAGDVLDSER